VAIAVLFKLDATSWYPTELGSMPASGLLAFILFAIVACIVGATVNLILAGVQKASAFLARNTRKEQHQNDNNHTS
jgi:hypothetical protein